MIKHVYTHNGSTLIRTEEATPKCGEDFCDACGDCLACYGDDECMGTGKEHFWVQYEESEAGDA